MGIIAIAAVLFGFIAGALWGHERGRVYEIKRRMRRRMNRGERQTELA